MFGGILGFLIGIVCTVILIPEVSSLYIERDAAIAECEKSLPRNQQCKYVITAKVIKNE